MTFRRPSPSSPLPAPISNGSWTSRRRSQLPTRQRLRDGIEAPQAGYELLKRMTFDDRIRTALPFLARHRRRPEPAAPCQLRQRRPALPPRHQAGEHLRQTGRHQGYRLRARRSWLPAAGAAARPDDGHTRRRSAAGTLHFRSPEQKEHFDVANVEVNVAATRSFSTSAIRNSAAASSKRATASSSAGTRRRIRHIIQDIVPAPPRRRSACRSRPDPIRSGMASRPRSSS